MYSIRKWIFRPKKSDDSNLAQFFYADEELNLVAAELDSFDGRKDPERCTALVNQLRHSQDKVLSIIEKVMNDAIPTQRANRDFRVKFPDDVLQESLAGQLWFGAECLAAGSSIMNREVESASMRPLAKALTRHLDFLRSSLRDQCLRNQNDYADKITNALIVFDRLFAEFELSYVSAMVPVKTMKEYDLLQEVVVLFCETVHRAMRLKLLNQNQIDDYDPALMFTIPRLAIVCGLLVYPEGPLNPDMDPMNMSEMFRPFQTLLYKIRELLWTLSREELWLLEKSLCSTDDPTTFSRNLSIEDQLNSINTDCDSKQKLTNTSDEADPCKISQSGSEYSEDSCVMSHSLSNNTIVDSPDNISYDARSKHSSTGRESCETDTASNSSAYAEETAEHTDEIKHLQQQEAGCSGGGGARSLRHSQSWPEAARRPHRRSRLTPEENRVEVDSAASMEILEDLEADAPRLRCRHSTGSREFCFHLPLNTAESSAIPCVTQEESEQNTQQIILTGESTCKEDVLVEDGQISFVTEALNQVFLTDPTFKGVLVSEWNQRPRRDSLVGDSDMENNIDKSGACQTNTDSLNTDDYNTSSCDNPLDSCKRQQSPGSSKTSPSGKGKKLHNTDGSDRPDSAANKSRSHRSRVDVDSKTNADCLGVPKLHKGKPGDINSRSHSPNVDYDWDRESYTSSETSSYNSDSHDDEEIALAIQAAEIAARQEARGRFKSSSDLIHRLFVCISGVADQLQTNYASDLRHILKTVFDCSSTPMEEEEVVKEEKAKECEEHVALSDSSDSDEEFIDEEGNQNPHINTTSDPDAEAPEWMPDQESPHCMACKVPFTFVRRRHHCRNCGKIFCGRCSSNSVPLPHYGHDKPVRVCNHCFVFQVTPFTVE